MTVTPPTQLDAAARARPIAARVGAARECEAELFRRFAPRVRLFGLRHLHTDPLADDLVQRVMLVTIQKLRDGAVREPEHIGSFVLGTARVLARDQRRSDRLLPVDSAPSGEALVDEPDPYLRKRLVGCVEQLGERERAIVVLSFFQEQDSTEIGTTLGMQPPHVRVARHRALAQLRDCLTHPREEVA